MSETRKFFMDRTEKEKSLYQKISKPDMSFSNEKGQAGRFSYRNINVSENEE